MNEALIYVQTYLACYSYHAFRFSVLPDGSFGRLMLDRNLGVSQDYQD